MHQHIKFISSERYNTVLRQTQYASNMYVDLLITHSAGISTTQKVYYMKVWVNTRRQINDNK